MHVELIKNETLSELDTIRLREHFVSRYCSSQGWDQFNLTMEQVLEIRSHKEWKTPGMLKS